ncbi:hypothetical protein OG604_46450 [Streptomyces sp. NBC_01231]|nr:hypothetical protein OG604_46450 [Streptomyces sp. NBC_01231]
MNLRAKTGSPPLLRQGEGTIAARRTVEGLMRENGLESVIRRRRHRTTVPELTAPDLVVL